jgi:septal ring factor EnvC (AmiA/AmiB activator)
MRERALALRQERGQLIADARRCLADTNLSVEERNNRFDELMAKSDELKTEIDRIEALLIIEVEEAKTAALGNLPPIPWRKLIP